MIIPSFPLKKRKNCVLCGVALNSVVNAFEFIYANLICFPCHDKLTTISIGPDYCFKIMKCKKIEKYKDFSVIIFDDGERLLMFSMICYKSQRLTTAERDAIAMSAVSNHTLVFRK